MAVRRKVSLGAIVATAALAAVAVASPAQAAGSGYDYFYWSGKAYQYFGNDRQSGSTVIASTNVPVSTCLGRVRSVQTTITMPDGRTTSHSSLLGQCASGAQLNLGRYTIFQAKTTHQVTLVNGVRYSFTD